MNFQFIMIWSFDDSLIYATISLGPQIPVTGNLASLWWLRDGIDIFLDDSKVILEHSGLSGIWHQIFSMFKSLFTNSQIKNILVDLQYICSGVWDDSWAMLWPCSTFLPIWGIHGLTASHEFTSNPQWFHHKPKNPSWQHYKISTF